MTDWLFPAALALTGTMGVLMGLWGLWYLISGLACVRKPQDYGLHPAQTKFAILIAARNEELVIGPLINSLLTQSYPAKLYDIWVIPNNCADNTALAARSFGAKVLECTVPVKSKGEVLRFAYNRLRGRRYDAWLVFDADNVVDRNFLAEMNNVRLTGVQAAQGYRDSKNPYDTALSGCSSIYYWMMDRFHNGGKAGLGLSAMIGGTGFMVTQSLLDKLGGWRTETISEDMEITVQALLAGERVAYAPKAITYDEQPLTWEQSFKQRRRWTSGTIQVAEAYLPALAQELGERPRLALLDMGSTMVLPAYQLAALAGLIPPRWADGPCFRLCCWGWRGPAGISPGRHSRPPLPPGSSLHWRENGTAVCGRHWGPIGFSSSPGCPLPRSAFGNGPPSGRRSATPGPWPHSCPGDK
ncbi:hypothetical protein N510_000304 [Firmicutes bacterium ASF500]|nr:hypothetical protein N510_000304 [Firmicutes bacterium ASF500]